MNRALVIYGGWEGHEPHAVAQLLTNALKEEQFVVELSDTLDCLKNSQYLNGFDLIVLTWTMGSITPEQLNPLLVAVQHGVGIAGCHGGLGDSFRSEPEFQYMVGGQWVAHPGNDGVNYEVKIKYRDHPITAGIQDFSICSEQYYMHVDPSIDVLATTMFYDHVEMPVAWTKTYGRGRVFYCSLGHQANIVAMPQVLQMMKQGMVWAAENANEVDMCGDC